jgi:hypothetical protein
MYYINKSILIDNILSTVLDLLLLLYKILKKKEGYVIFFSLLEIKINDLI